MTQQPMEAQQILDSVKLGRDEEANALETTLPPSP